MARNFGAPPSFGALALQSNPAHYGLPGSPGIRGGITRPVIYGTDEDASNINKERDRKSRGSGGSGGVVRASTGGGGVIIRSDGTVINLNGLGYGSPDADDVKRGLAGAGAAGFGIMGALIGAGIGASIQFRGKPLKDGWLYGSMVGFLLPVILLAPKKEESV